MSVVPGCKVCARCSSEFSEIINRKKQAESEHSTSSLSSESDTLSDESKISDEFQSSDMTLTQVCLILY